MPNTKAKALFAFDLDGTLLNSLKQISSANTLALQQITANGNIVAFTSGRLGKSMEQYVSKVNVDIAMLTLNGAEIYMGAANNNQLVKQTPLNTYYGDFLLDYCSGKNFALNYYIHGNLYSTLNNTTRPWINLYIQQTSTIYSFIDSFHLLMGGSPSKIIFIGHPSVIDKEEEFFRKLWGESVYICRTWDHYLEFLAPAANKGNGLQTLAQAYGIDMRNTVAFGDASNDIPMLSKAGLGIAVNNASALVKEAADYVSQWTNDEDAIAREWDAGRLGF